jgi:hypothetical protein
MLWNEAHIMMWPLPDFRGGKSRRALDLERLQDLIMEERFAYEKVG